MNCSRHCIPFQPPRSDARINLYTGRDVSLNSHTIPELFAKKLFFIFFIIFALTGRSGLNADSSTVSNPSDLHSFMDYTAQGNLWQELLLHPPSWFAGPEAIAAAENILVWQRESGGWPKNISLLKTLEAEQRSKLQSDRKRPRSTIDNGATYTEMLFLARVIEAQPDSRYILSFQKGLDYLLRAQYSNGGWPQYYPLRRGYYEYITFNDDAMVGVLTLLRDILTRPDAYSWLDSSRISAAESALQKGVDCILATQIHSGGRPTAWCAQYDHRTLLPAPARKYELVSLSGKETVGIVEFLMGLEHPDPQVIRAVTSAVAWLQEVRIPGIRQESFDSPGSPTGSDRRIVEDPDSDGLWARFYDIETHQPFFSDRDGKRYEKMEQISWERRNEYGWYGDWPEKLLEKEFPRWQQMISKTSQPAHELNEKLK